MSSRDRNRSERNRNRYAEIRMGNLTEGRTIADAAACPDCNSIVEMEPLTHRINRGVVRHDETCPWLAAFEARAGRHGTKSGA